MKLLFISFFSISVVLYTSAENQHINDSTLAEQTYFEAANLIRNGLYSGAIKPLKISLEIREKLYSKESYEFGLVHNALGITYRNLGNLNKAIEHFLYAEEAYLSVLDKNNLAIARLYNNTGNVYYNKLNYGTASDYYQKALNIFENQDEIDKAGIADVYYSLANTHFRLIKYNEALNIIDKYNTQAYSDTKLYFLSLKAAIYQELNQFNEAYSSYRNAINHARDLYSDSDLNLAFEYINFSDFLIKNNKIDEAESTLNFVQDIFMQNNIQEGLYFSLYLKTKGLLYENLVVETRNIETFRSRKTSNLTEAIKSYGKGLEALGMDLNSLTDASVSVASTLSLTQSLELLKLIADTYIQIFDIYLHTTHQKKEQSIKYALDYYKITSNLIQQARREIYSDENKIQLSEIEEATFLKIIHTAYKAHEIAPASEVTEFAFSSAERMKASSVFDRLSDQFAKENSLVPDSLTELERSLNYSITSHNEKLFNLRRSDNPDQTEIASIDSTLFQLKKQRDELSQHIEKNYNDYFNLKYANSTVSISEIQKNLNSNEVLIEYVLNETGIIPELYAFCISGSYIGFHQIEIDSSFVYSVEKTFRFISNPAYLFTRNDNSKEYCVAAHHLYQKLVEPFTDIIQNKKLTIIPDGKLSYLPFDALLTEMPDTTGKVMFNQLPYLIKSHTVNYAYSANLLFKFGNQQRKAKNRLLAFAPEYKSDTVMFENERLILTPLPGIQREVDLISDEIRTKLFKGDDATELNFRKFSKNHDILHLAMHAFINDSLPAFSRFAFAQNHEETPENDGWLNTADIYNLDLTARLTVLSACNTGTGNLRKGEGVMSLARGFLYAGCPTIVMTLWEVEDNAGTKIMSSFYQNLKKGRSTDEALRLAKLKYLEAANPRMGHPHYWLGYVSIGNSKPLFRSYDFYFFGLLIIALAAISADQLIRMKKARKKRYSN
jgi:CHAT domain-containing protein/tetratricopeptide (TPR) repeat protein